MSVRVWAALLVCVVCGGGAAAFAQVGMARAWRVPREGEVPAVRRQDPLVDAWLRKQAWMAREGGPLPRMYPGERTEYANVELGVLDVTRVDADVHLNLDVEGELAVTAWVTLVPLMEGQGSLGFPVNLPELVGVSAEGVGMPEAVLEDGELSLVFPEPLPVGQEVKLTMSYKGKLDCGQPFLIETCKLKGDIRYVTHSAFLPTFGGFNDLHVGTMRVFVSGKKKDKANVGGTGTFMGSVAHADTGEVEFVFEHTDLTSLYAFAVGTLVRVHGAAGAVPTSVLLPPSKAENAGTTLWVAADAIGRFSDWYVPYPWGKLDVVAMPDSFGGGFGPLSTIMVTKWVLDAKADDWGAMYGAMELISHEIAHQWWGDLVEMVDVPDIITSEGLAEFSSALYFEKAAGSPWTFLSDGMTYTYTVAHDEEPSIVSPFVYYSEYYVQVVYYKGASIFNMLRYELGEEVLLAALSEWALTHAKTFATVGELFGVLEEVSGQDLEWFYNQWLAGTGCIGMIVAGTWDEGAKVYRLSLKQKTVLTFIFSLPVVMELVDGQTVEQVLRVDKKEQVLELPLPTAVRRLYLDPYRTLLRRLGPGLPGDVDLSGQVDGADLVEMSFAYQNNIVAQSNWGQYFFPNPRYVEVADLVGEEGAGDVDGKVDGKDADWLVQSIMEPGAAVPDGR